VSRGYIATNPLHRLDRIEKPKQVSEREARRLSDAEVRALCSAAAPGYRAVVATLAWTGLRASEALGLCWEDIDFEGRELRVRHQLDGQGKLKKPKTRAGSRSIPLLPVLEKELREHRQKQFARGLATPEQLVFTTMTGKPLDRHNSAIGGFSLPRRRRGL
jgi:integrase